MDLLPHIELVTGPEPVGTVIWMHGLGADGWDFVPIVRELPLPEGLELRFIFPHAPVRPVTINNGMEMRAWYDIAMNDIARLPDERGIRESQAEVEQLIARERGRGVGTERIALVGFSQGGAIALQVGLRHAGRLAGIAALSTYLPLEESLDAEGSSANRTTRIFMAHGAEDQVVPLRLAETSRAALERRGYRVEWQVYPMPHAVCGEEIQDLADFLAGTLGGPAVARSSILIAR
ncbi:MAG TPA: dienelactone hydrolase family protein [Usitatibacter sp.]|nr:dienelactone hydrolase family protein [Usitatibacter sp.]